MNPKENHLSHIIVLVNKIMPRSPVLTFCTNVKNENASVGFTYLCYDNSSGEDSVAVLQKNLENSAIDRDSAYLVTDSGAALSYAAGFGTGCAALAGSHNRDEDLSAALYCIEDIEYMTYGRLEKMWERSRGIPWTIAVTDRLMIREHSLSDIDGLYDIYADPEISKYVEPLYEDRDQETEYLKDYINNQYRYYEYGMWAVTKRDDGTLIGRAGIGLRSGYETPEVGYLIGSKYRKKGYAKEALSAVIGYGQKELGMDEFMAFTKEENIPSVRLLSSLGFTKRGSGVVMGSEHAMYVLTKQP